MDLYFHDVNYWAEVMYEYLLWGTTWGGHTGENLVECSYICYIYICLIFESVAGDCKYRWALWQKKKKKIFICILEDPVIFFSGV